MVQRLRLEDENKKKLNLLHRRALSGREEKKARLSKKETHADTQDTKWP